MKLDMSLGHLIGTDSVREDVIIRLVYTSTQWEEAIDGA